MSFVRICILAVCLIDFAGGILAYGKEVSLTLGDALQKAGTINLHVMMANARLQQAIARVRQAQSDLLPHLEGTASTARQTTDLRAEGIRIPGLGTHVGPYNSFDVRARVTVALFDPSAFERFQAAKKGETLSSAQLEKTREDILALVATLFIDAQRKQQSAKLLKTLLDRDQMAYDLSHQQLAEGTGTLLDSNKSKSDLDQTKYLYSQAQLLAEDARLDLEAALQMPLDEPLLFLDDRDLLKNLENEAATNFNNAANADLVLASSQLEARKADRNAAIADFLPKISGNANYGRLGSSPTNGSNTYYLGVQATVPVWEGGIQQAKLKETREAVKEAQENLLDVTQQQSVNSDKARAAIVETDDLRQAKAQKQRTAQQSLMIALQSMETGSGSAFEVMEAKALLALAENEYNEAQASWVMAHIDLLHDQGRLRQLVKKKGD